MNGNKLQRGLVRLWNEWGRPILLAVVIVLPLRASIADWYEVPSGSMQPTILEGDRIFVNKLAYDLRIPFTHWRIAEWDAPGRGDVVVFKSPYDGNRLVKRVIGLPGDRISMVDNRLYVNGEPVVYEPLNGETPRGLNAPAPMQFMQEELPGRTHTVMLMPALRSIDTFPEQIVPPGRYFMMGDNRDNSADSRYIGFVERDRILGKATTVVLSLNYDNYHLPRWQRFFVGL